MPKSSYYEWQSKLKTVDKINDELIEKIRDIVEESKGRYGYRRVTKILKNFGYTVNHKRVLRIMKEYNMTCTKFNRKNRKYKSYKGTVGKIADNVLDRNFHVSEPNQFWVTDVSEFKVNGQKLYLSPILDLFNMEIVSFSLSSKPTTSFTNDSLLEALKILPVNNALYVHSDQGFHYQHESWVSILKSHSVSQSMSRKGNCIDNSPMENFFSLLKQEMYYGRKFKNSDELKKEIIEYIDWYNHDRIKEKLGWISPICFRENYKKAMI